MICAAVLHGISWAEGAVERLDGDNTPNSLDVGDLGWVTKGCGSRCLGAIDGLYPGGNVPRGSRGLSGPLRIGSACGVESSSFIRCFNDMGPAELRSVLPAGPGLILPLALGTLASLVAEMLRRDDPGPSADLKTSGIPSPPALSE